MWAQARRSSPTFERPVFPSNHLLPPGSEQAMKVLVIDVGGTHVKLLASGQTTHREFDSGPTMTPDEMVAGVRKTAEGWEYEVVSMGYPGPVLRGKPLSEPHNLGPGWVGYDFQAALHCPVKIINDAAMQALGSYQGGRMLFLGLGTGLGSAMIVDGILEPMELAHLPYRHGKTYEEYLGLRGLKRLGKKKWRKEVFKITEQLIGALQADYVVLGGGNAKKLKELPPGARMGRNENAILGGFRLWAKEGNACSPQTILKDRDVPNWNAFSLDTLLKNHTSGTRFHAQLHVRYRR